MHSYSSIYTSEFLKHLITFANADGGWLVIGIEDEIVQDATIDDIDEQMILHFMYNSGKKLTTAKTSEMTGRSRNYCSRVLKNLLNLDF